MHFLYIVKNCIAYRFVAKMFVMLVFRRNCDEQKISEGIIDTKISCDFCMLLRHSCMKWRIAIANPLHRSYLDLVAPKRQQLRHLGSSADTFHLNSLSICNANGISA